MDNYQFNFLLEAYKLAIEYFNEYSNRLYTRYNILLTIEVTLAGLYVSLWSNPQFGLPQFPILPMLGLMVSILFYIQSAQDKYILKSQIKRINQLLVKINEAIGRDDLPALFSPLDETDTGNKNFVFESIFSWRSNLISMTRVPTLMSLTFIVIWILIGVLHK